MRRIAVETRGQRRAGHQRAAHRVPADAAGDKFGGGMQVTADSLGMVTVEEHPLTHDGGQEGHHIDLDLGPPVDEPVLQRHRSHEPTGVPAALDARHVDDHVLLQPVHDHRMTCLVQGDAVALPLHVLVVVGQAVFLD